MATEKITKTLYGGKVTINFFPNSHQYKMEGLKTNLISATAMTGVLNKPFLIPWAVGLAKSHMLKFLEGKGSISPEELYPVIDEAAGLHERTKEEAGGIGSQIHDWAEQFAKSKINGTPEPDITEDMDPRVLNGISAFLDFYNTHDVEFYETERLTYSMLHGWVGITDLVAKVDGVKTVLDHKTGKYIYDEQYFQLGQYWMSLDEEAEYLKSIGETGFQTEPIEQGMILHYNKETGDFTMGLLTKEEHMINMATIKALFTIKKRLKELEANKRASLKESKTATE